MCDQHYADGHILCSQCDMLVKALPERVTDIKPCVTLRRNVDDRVGRAAAASHSVTHWQRISCCCSSNLFPFIYMRGGRTTSRGIPL